ncbi:MAG: lytic transglycosylase domain-containing protein [Candidatus Solibacter usitatus]|nr:lytic transglycosylase domain-containing protein [Candidatus Solibacter usitatus]
MVRTLIVVLALTVTAWAGEYAVLGSGFRIHVDRHESAGKVVRLYYGSGVTELAADAIVGFEADEIVAEKASEPAAVTTPVAAPSSPRALVEEAARKHGLPPEFLHSVAAAESGYRADAVSPKGAIGLMQMMPGTAKAYGADASVPEQNVDAGARYLRDLLLKYRGDDHQVSRALAAYNAGPGAVERYHGVPPYQETQDYVARVIRDYTKRKTTSPKTPDRSSPPE